MGVSVEAFRDVGLTHARNNNVGDFSFSSCRSAAVDGLNFDVHQHAFSAESSVSSVHGVEAFLELRGFIKGVSSVGCEEGFCEPATNAHALSEGGDEVLDWVSPRISFSHDFLMDESAASRTCSAFSEKRKWQVGGENGDVSDGCSSEFEFSSKCAITDTAAGQTTETMLTADELFSEGKLIPMVHVQKMSSSGFESDIHREWQSLVHESQKEELSGNKACMHSINPIMKEMQADDFISVNSREKFLVRHLSMELPRLNPSSTMGGSAPAVSVSLECSPCSSPTRSSDVLSSAAMAAQAASSALSKGGSKYTSKIKEFFKPKRVSSSTSPQLTRDHSMMSSSTCRIPIPPRSFWPFLRSNSAAESKAAPPFIPQRSFSAGEADTSRLSNNSNEKLIPEMDEKACLTDVEAVAAVPAGEDESQSSNPLSDTNIEQGCSNFQSVSELTESSRQITGCSNDQSFSELTETSRQITGCTNVQSFSESTETLRQLTGCTNVQSLSELTETSRQIDGCSNAPSCSESTETSGQVFAQEKDIVCSHKVKLSWSPGQASRNRYSRMTSNFLRGSPGRRGGMSSFAKAHGSRIVLRNLERCTADKKLCRETSSRRAGAYPVVMRVSPVINVAVYRGKVPSSSMFGLRGLFSSKKQKAKEKDATGVNNWRASA